MKCSVAIAAALLLGGGCLAEVEQPSSARPIVPIPPRIELLTVQESIGTVPQEIQLSLNESFMLDVHSEPPIPSRLEVDSTLFHKTNVVGNCITATVELSDSGGESASAVTFVMERAPVIAIPLVHSVQLTDGLYAERVRISWTGGSSPDFAGYRFFESLAGNVKGVSADVYSQRVDFDSSDVPPTDDYADHLRNCSAFEPTRGNNE